MTAIRLLVCGGRDYADRVEVERVIATLPPGSTVIHGACPRRRRSDGQWGSADWLADEAARARGLAVEPYRAHWHLHEPGWCRCGNPSESQSCPGAGPRRNQRMIDEGRPTHYYAFPGGRGTADMVRRCEAAGVLRWSYLDILAALLAREAEHDAAEAVAFTTADNLLVAKIDLVDRIIGTAAAMRCAGGDEVAEQGRAVREELRQKRYQLHQMHACWQRVRLFLLYPSEVPAPMRAAWQAGEELRQLMARRTEAA